MRRRNERSAPQPWLRTWVADAIGRSSTNTPATYRIFPNTNCEIFFNFGDHETNTSVGSTFRRLGKATVFGPKIRCYQHRVGVATDWFLVQLTPLGTRALLDCPIAAFSNADIDLSDVLADSDALVDRIASADDFVGRLTAFEGWAAQRISSRAAHDRISALSALHGAMRVSPFSDVGRFAQRLDLGKRQFRSVFSDELGLAPKKLLGLLRLEQGWTSLYRTGSIAEASALYADQAHFTREFRRFTQITPSEYRKLKRSGDTILNGFDEGLIARLTTTS